MQVKLINRIDLKKHICNIKKVLMQKYIRNFSIIAHIDHGKSTLADRILEFTGALQPREMKAQFLDKMEIERERGITIKSQAVRLHYKSCNKSEYLLNLIDTPGHVDFGYEVSRSLSACEGAILIVDATQGVQAQTIANVRLAIENNLTIIPVINKIDLPNADPERVKKEIEEIIGIDASACVLTSGKTGEGIEDLLEIIVNKIPAPNGNTNASLQALVFDSWFDPYKGVVVLVRIVHGVLNPGDSIYLMSNKKEFEVQSVGAFSPNSIELKKLSSGEVGFIVANIKSVTDTKVGDTITSISNPAANAIIGFKDVKPMVFAGIFPTDSSEYNNLKDSLLKLALNDSSLVFEPESSQALGFGYRCGFLGLLHMEIVQERLEREFDLDIIVTAPSVLFKAHLKSGEIIPIDSPTKMPDPIKVNFYEEPFANVDIHSPIEYIGSIISLCEMRRGEQIAINYLKTTHVTIQYYLPISEIVFDFFDKLKSLTRGYASFDYDLAEYRKAKLVKVDILINGDAVDALSLVLHHDSAYVRGKSICETMKNVIPKQQYQVSIQAAIGGKIIARETISALRKDVTAKCYGGDITRKRKLLEKQKRGKKRMRKIGKIDVPQAAFLSVLKIN